MNHILWSIGHDLLIEDIVKAKGSYLYDSKGSKYIDLEAGIWCASLGHNHPDVLKAIQKQMRQISHTGFCYANPMIEEAAKEVLNILEFTNGRCVFLCSGSEAIEFGVRAAQKISEKPLLLILSDSNFGAYGSVSKKSENEWFSFDWQKCASCSKQESCDSDCERFREIPFDKIGGFLFESGSSSGVIHFPPAKLIQNITQRVKNSGGFILVNEVTTGIGRTCEWFGYNHYKIQPDIVAMGKGIGNGYPVSICAVNQNTAELMAAKAFKYGQSHQNDPLGASAAREVVRTIRKNGLIEKSGNVAKVLMNGLHKLREHYPVIKEIRGRGLMIALEINDDKNNSRTALIFNELLKRKFIISRRPGLNVLRIDPALTISEKDIRKFLSHLEEILRNQLNSI